MEKNDRFCLVILKEVSLSEVAQNDIFVGWKYGQEVVY